MSRNGVGPGAMDATKKWTGFPGKPLVVGAFSDFSSLQVNRCTGRLDPGLPLASWKIKLIVAGHQDCYIKQFTVAKCGIE